MTAGVATAWPIAPACGEWELATRSAIVGLEFRYLRDCNGLILRPLGAEVVATGSASWEFLVPRDEWNQHCATVNELQDGPFMQG